MNKHSIAVLIGGNGSNLQALIDYSMNSSCHYSVDAVISHNPNAYGLQRAKDANIPYLVIDSNAYSTREEYDTALMEHLNTLNPEWIVLAGFMRILTPNFVNHFKNRLINIHPSLLPKHKGLHTHQRVLEAHDKEHGCTVHIVIPELDSGSIIAQCKFSVTPTDTADSLKSRVHKAEHFLYPMVINWFAMGKLNCRNNCIQLDGQAIPGSGLAFELTETDVKVPQ